MDGNGTVVGNDPFCEHIFWRSVGVRPFVANPVGMVTGFFMFVQGVIPNVRVGGDRSRVHYHPSLPGVFYLCKAELACVGIGTVLFHALSDGDAAWWHVNDGMMDWVPIVLMTNAVMALYLCGLLDAGECLMGVVFFFVCLWSCVLIVVMDSGTRDYYSGLYGGQDTYGAVFNAALLVPLCLTLAWAGATRIQLGEGVAWFWVGIGVNIALWGANTYGCHAVPALFVLHCVYHVTIAWVFVFAACLGVCLDRERWRFRGLRWGWPEIEPKFADMGSRWMNVRIMRGCEH